uniref:Uncharacterized protein n=1 Tax=Glossina palpalis gambiensis TaxID=67801 RepID=A0A1B0APT8_9MUSC
MITWTARDAIQEAREACGGHGYLKASKLGDLRNDHDSITIRCYEWLMCYLLETTSNHINHGMQNGLNRFDARNNAQVYGAGEVSLVYAEYFCITCFIEAFKQPDITLEYSTILRLIFEVYSMLCLDKHMTTYYVGGVANSLKFADLIRMRLLSKCGELKDISVSVADALAPPDFALNSVIGKSDGLLYENLQNVFMINEGAFERPTWWKDIVITKFKSKL